MLPALLRSHSGIDPSSEAGSGDAGTFRLRGREVSRLEAFSDAVFGFALTLLVVSLDVPASFADLLDRLKGSIAFAICFGLLVWIWHQHYTFFRRYGLADATTMVLNTILLFVVLLYVYPLKFLFSVFVAMLVGVGPASAFNTSAKMTLVEVRLLFLIFGLGYAAVVGVFALLHAHAYRLRDKLDLSPVERFDTVTGIQESAAIAAVGLLSAAVAALAGPRWISMAGWMYCAIGLIAGAIGTARRARRRRLLAGPEA